MSRKVGGTWKRAGIWDCTERSESAKNTNGSTSSSGAESSSLSVHSSSESLSSCLLPYSQPAPSLSYTFCSAAAAASHVQWCPLVRVCIAVRLWSLIAPALGSYAGLYCWQASGEMQELQKVPSYASNPALTQAAAFHAGSKLCLNVQQDSIEPLYPHTVQTEAICISRTRIPGIGFHPFCVL